MLTRKDEKTRITKSQCKSSKIKITHEDFEKLFPIVRIEQISIRDRFLQYTPQTSDERRIKEAIIHAKREGMKNFRKPAMDPAITRDRQGIVYCKGKQPAINKSINWWIRNAYYILPEKNPRIMHQKEMDIFLGYLIKQLVEDGYSTRLAWHVVCHDSKELGHYFDSPRAKGKYENTGSRKVCKEWYDLANTKKIVLSKDGEIVAYGGHKGTLGSNEPLSHISNNKSDIYCSVVEIRLDV